MEADVVDPQSALDGIYVHLSERWQYEVADENGTIVAPKAEQPTEAAEGLTQWTLAETASLSGISESDIAIKQRTLHSPGLGGSSGDGWRLDFTEGRSRMRRRLIPSNIPRPQYQSQTRRRAATLKSSPRPTVGLGLLSASSNSTVSAVDPDRAIRRAQSFNHTQAKSGRGPTDPRDELEYDILDLPKAHEQVLDGGHKIILRSLAKADVVQHVFNVGRLFGVEAFEGLLIIGKMHMYLQDGYFRRSDGEILELNRAPQKERDPFLRIISGQEKDISETSTPEDRLESHRWAWKEILSMSKRRFLFRDVALELFFSGGESLLLTVRTQAKRDELWMKLVHRAPQTFDPSTATGQGSLPRLDMIQSLQDRPQTFGSKLSNAFSQGVQLPATKAWVRGQISNFEYLMLLNTVAGRTFNDLTQYPVFPWILADYKSEELDLFNPRSFRDLSKPMGCQSSSRERGFKERYKAFAEMGDKDAPPFHYGTHYSSAMIVTSWLIRLQPFVQSYILMQGGQFDHPDRLFFSIEEAWKSAAQAGMSDVRELIPEFFFLPEFLVNGNGFDFGLRQGGESIDSVTLPPWAKEDASIFISKHREALESRYVSENLHQWIDLVFGCKQRGEAALEAINVFHHLSYRGAKDLDEMKDTQERLATVGIIHNFGQTPNQIFQRPHPHREKMHHNDRLLDSCAETLTRAAEPLLWLKGRITSLVWSVSQDHIIASGRQRAWCPPAFDRYARWGYWDHSIRFFRADDSKQIGLFGRGQPGQVTCGVFLGPSTLITGGMDNVMTIWRVNHRSKVYMTKRDTLLGHQAPIAYLACAGSYATLVSADEDGVVKCWNTNTGEFVRDLIAPEAEGGEKSAVSAVTALAIDDNTGEIAIARGSSLQLCSLNGLPLLTQPLPHPIISTTFHLPGAYEWLERALVLTGHPHGVAMLWHKAVLDGKFELVPVTRLEHRSQFNTEVNVPAGISCLLTSREGVWTGDEEGRVWWWGLGEGGAKGDRTGKGGGSGSGSGRGIAWR